MLIGNEDYLAHHGIKGQKWGIRRFQNEDGSLTDAGKKRANKLSKRLGRAQKEAFRQERKVNKMQKGIERYSHRPRWMMDDRAADRLKKFGRRNDKYNYFLKRANRIYEKTKKEYETMKLGELDSKYVEQAEHVIEQLAFRKIT